MQWQYAVQRNVGVGCVSNALLVTDLSCVDRTRYSIHPHGWDLLRKYQVNIFFIPIIFIFSFYFA